MDLQIASIETERLVIRPFELSDYENWYKGFSDRSPSLYKYDEGRPITMEHNTRERFEKWIRGFAEAAMKDQMTNLGIFRKKDGLNVGKVELFTILRMDYQWGMMGYSLHNQFWKKAMLQKRCLRQLRYFMKNSASTALSCISTPITAHPYPLPKEAASIMKAHERSSPLKMENGRIFSFM